VPIGRVAGIEIRLHWTFFLLVALLAVATTDPQSPGVVSLTAWLVLVFGSVVAHELSHCFVGRTRGVVVHEILLLPIGGISKLENLPDTPSDELAIAIAGPAASAGLAVLAGCVALLLDVRMLPIDLVDGAFVARLFWFNVIVAAFNLLPAFPLDGGRVLRALLERRYDLERATRVAATFGRTVAIVMIVAGIFFDLWLTIVGVFVYFGASAEEASTIVHLRLSGHRVSEVMLLEPVTVEPNTPAAELRELLRRSAQRVFPVLGATGFEGMVDAPVIMRAATGETAAELADRDAPIVGPADSLEDDLTPLVGTHARALAVVEHGHVVGVVRLEDVQHLVTDNDGRASQHRGRSR
jgi:Zn-dependent protease